MVLIYIYCEITIAVGAANIHHLIQIQYKEKKDEKKKISPCDENSGFNLLTVFLYIIQQH